MISIILPYHDTEKSAFFLKRAIDSVMKQTYQDYEIVLTKAGKMAENTNAGIRKSKGEIIKILFMDDYLYHENVLQEIVDAFDESDKQWLATGCIHDNGELFNPHFPVWSDDIAKGVNTIGSPSVVAFKGKEYFDENLSWTLDCDLYVQMKKKYGEPILLNSIGTVIGIGDHQTTNVLTDQQKGEEVNYLIKKYA